MGQKVHPEIFKLSRTAGWRSKYFEKKTIDTSLHQNKDFEIKKFIKQFFKKRGLNICSCNCSLLNTRLHISASYTKNNKLINGVLSYPKKKCPKFKPNTASYSNSLSKKNKPSRSTENLVKANFKKLIFLIFFCSKGAVFANDAENRSQALTRTRFSSTYIPPKLPMRDWRKRLSAMFFTEGCRSDTKPLNYLTKLLYPNLDNNDFTKPLDFAIETLAALNTKTQTLHGLEKNKNSCTYKFMILFFKSFYFFFGKSPKFTLILKYLNKNFKKARPKMSKFSVKKKVTSLKKYGRNKFFKEGLNLMVLMASQKESSEVLASYIATSIKNFKKHKLLLNFVKKGLYKLAKRRKTHIKAVKIQLKGRINGADRARSYTITPGRKASLITIGTRINYSESTAFTPDGTLSVKVWVCYRKGLTEFKSRCCIKNKIYANCATKN